MKGPSLCTAISLVITLKILAFYCYISTDFDVHRNWLSITYSLPLREWYTEHTSEWTLDYPPFFGYFEWILAQIAALVDSSMLNIQKDPYRSVATVLFQRWTVIFGDIVFLSSCIALASTVAALSNLSKYRAHCEKWVLICLLFGNGGIFLVDNIHFQYNAILFGLLLFSIKCLMEERIILSSLLYIALLHFKHIYVYMAPAYVAFIFRNYLVSNASGNNLLKHFLYLDILKVFKLGSTICSVFLISLGPFVYLDRLPALISRLFPFKRGLTHAYWAPNFWALYNFADLLLSKLFNVPKLSPGFSSGLVQEHSHNYLPSIDPLTCAMVTVLTILPFFIVCLCQKGGVDSFLRLLVLSSFSSFMFGWHVHEKAILLITVPLTILAIRCRKYLSLYVILSCIGNFSLFPLFFTQFQYPIMYFVTLSVFVGTLLAINILEPNPSRANWFPENNCYECVYLFGLILLELAKLSMPYLLVTKNLTFLPLLSTSVYCAIGVLYCWIKFIGLWLIDELGLDIIIHRSKWIKIQDNLRHEVVEEDVEEWQETWNKSLKIIAGLDISTPEGDSRNACVCMTLFQMPQLKLLHTEVEHVTIDQPYIPGLLAFREADPMVKTVNKLIKEHPEFTPQLILIDGNGILHPRKFGLACSIGVETGIASVGVAKNLHLVQGIDKETLRLAKDEKRIFSVLNLKDEEGNVIGAALRCTKGAKNPVYVSVGHNLNLQTAINVTIAASKHRIPEPIRIADQVSRAQICNIYDSPVQ